MVLLFPRLLHKWETLAPDLRAKSQPAKQQQQQQKSLSLLLLVRHLATANTLIIHARSKYFISTSSPPPASVPGTVDLAQQTTGLHFFFFLFESGSCLAKDDLDGPSAFCLDLLSASVSDMGSPTRFIPC